MKLKIYDENSIKDKDDQLFLMLKGNLFENDKDIHLIVVNKKGESIARNGILSILNDFRCILIHSNINDDIPIKTNLHNKAIIIDEDEMSKFISIRTTDKLKEILQSKIEEKIMEKESEISRH